ncbi:uncharacterized protein LOC125061113 [Pieris napi]|uniref:uncharacterized protein LOC125061113 n=1 Tax=Pieris napi TaxID=78633 RepID=UPI001FB875F1|nr:uncharacterized protein LOC125061113 [Pieris napi]
MENINRQTNSEDNNPTSSQEIQTTQDNDDSSIVSNELVTNTVDFTSTETEQTMSHILPNRNVEILPISKQPTTSIPLLIFSRPTSLVMQNPVALSFNNSINIKTITTPETISNQPQTLFLLTLAKLNESSISLAFVNNRKISDLLSNTLKKENQSNLPELTPPDSITSAPPSYSFVLRQINARRRPRLMGTFIPSPSFITHPPPPNYAAAFDIYMDSTLPTPTTRVYHFGFTSMPVICTECGYTGMTMVRTKVTLCTHLCAFVLCIFCCWICAPLPYVLRSCKDVYHYCRNCRNYLGMYCPTNPDNHPYS